MTNIEKAETPKEVKKLPVKPAESVYSAEDLANNHKVFNARREIVEIALKLAGKKSATQAEAQAIINKFKNKEVK